MNKDKQPEALRHIGETQKELVKKLCENSTAQLWLSYCDKKMECEDLREDLESARQRIAELEAELEKAKSSISGLKKRSDDWKWRALNAEAELAALKAVPAVGINDQYEARFKNEAGAWTPWVNLGGGLKSEFVEVRCSPTAQDSRSAIAASAKGGV